MKPSSMCKSTTYVVDVQNLWNYDGIEKDEFGISNYSGQHPQPYKVHLKEKCCPGANGANVVL